MNFKIKIKPRIILGQTKRAVISKANLNGHCITSNFSGYDSLYHDDKFVYAVNFIKVRQKTKQVRDKSGKYIKSIVIRQNHWIGYLYKIPVAILEITNIKIKQKSRNFQIINK